MSKLFPKLADNARFAILFTHVDLLSGRLSPQLRNIYRLWVTIGMVIANLCIATLLGS